MLPGPASADPASEPGDPLPALDWMSAAEWEAWCDASAPGDEPPAFDEDEMEPDPEPGAWAGGASGFAAGNRAGYGTPVGRASLSRPGPGRCRS